MAALLKNKNGAKGKKVVHGKLPTKRTINLAGIGENPIKLKIALPAVILIVLVAAVLSKFFVYDRLQAMAQAQAEARAAQAELDSIYARMDQFGELSDIYAHYTYSDMTAAELNRADRVEVVTMLEEVIQPRTGTNAWTLTGNEVALMITGKSLDEINELVSMIEKQKWVNYCTVANATATLLDESEEREETETRDSGEESVQTVTSRITIYLRTPQEVSELEDTQS